MDIISRFNASYGLTNPDGTPCSPGSGWYYGLDGNTPAGLTNFLNVVMHEIAHGLGFSGFGNVSTGAPLAGFQDIYSRYVFDNNTQLGWYQLNNAGRQAAAIGGNLVFRGTHVTGEVPLVLGEKVVLRASGNASGDFDYGTAQFGPEASTSNFAGSVVRVNDGSALPNLGCAASPAGAYAGLIAIVDRGSCTFETKAKNAQDAGAIGVIVANNVSGTISMAEDPLVAATVPTVMVSLADGATIKAGLPGVNVALVPLPGVTAGADAAGFARLYAPNPVQVGSSFSHYDTSAVPNALMEPAITRSLAANLDVDLTNALFQDEGWSLEAGNALINGCDTNVELSIPGGIIVGASIQAWDHLCAASTDNKGEYQSCMNNYKHQLQDAGLIHGNQNGKISSCAAKRFK